MFNAGALLWLLRGRLDGIDGARVRVALFKILAASLVMGAAAHFTIGWMTALLTGTTTMFKAMRVSAAIAAGMLALIASARALRIEEFGDAFAHILRRVTPTR
jgi:hypothetical protein